MNKPAFAGGSGEHGVDARSGAAALTVEHARMRPDVAVALVIGFPSAVGLLVVAMALAVLHWLEGRSDRRRTLATVAVAVLALVVGLSSIVAVARIGDSGAHAVWGGS